MIWRRQRKLARVLERGFAALIVAVIAGAPTVAGATVCGLDFIMRETLKKRYGESRVGWAFYEGPTVFELWSSCATGTWSIFESTPRGISCLIFSGSGWRPHNCDPPHPHPHSHPQDLPELESNA